MGNIFETITQGARNLFGGGPQLKSPIPEGTSNPGAEAYTRARIRHTLGPLLGGLSAYKGSSDVLGAAKEGGLGAGGGGGGQTTGQEGTSSQEGSPPSPGLDFGAINEAMGNLDALENETRALLGGGEQQAEAFKGAATARAEEGREAGRGAIKAQEAETERRGGEAETGQRRGFHEIAQQFLGKFGRTSFGQGVTGSLAESTLQNIGRIRAGVQETMQKLFEQGQQIEREYKTAIEEANYQAETLKQNAKSQLQRALSEIGSLKTSLQSQKADMVNKALESYRQNIIDINARNASFQQQIELTKLKTDEALRLAQSKATNTLKDLASFTLSPGETIAIPASKLGGEEGLAQFSGTELPGGVDFETTGGYGVFSAPPKKDENSLYNSYPGGM